MEKSDETTNVCGETTIIDLGKDLSIHGGVEMNNATPVEGSSVILGEQNIVHDGETYIQDQLTSSEVVLCPISYCRDVFSTYLGKILDFVVVHWSFIFVSHVSRLIVEFL
jgi:hypothetical protein